jgi:hypothetical protein
MLQATNLFEIYCKQHISLKVIILFDKIVNNLLLFYIKNKKLFSINLFIKNRKL